MHLNDQIKTHKHIFCMKSNTKTLVAINPYTFFANLFQFHIWSITESLVTISEVCCDQTLKISCQVNYNNFVLSGLSQSKYTLLKKKRGRWFRVPPTINLRTNDVTDIFYIILKVIVWKFCFG